MANVITDIFTPSAISQVTHVIVGEVTVFVTDLHATGAGTEERERDQLVNLTVLSEATGS
jgi:hypothetical protein